MHSIRANFKYFTFPIFIINSNKKKNLSLSAWSEITHQAANLSSPTLLPKVHVLLGAVTGWSLHMQLKGPSYYYNKNYINIIMLAPGLKEKYFGKKKSAVENIYKSYTRN